VRSLANVKVCAKVVKFSSGHFPATHRVTWLMTVASYRRPPQKTADIRTLFVSRTRTNFGDSWITTLELSVAGPQAGLLTVDSNSYRGQYYIGSGTSLMRGANCVQVRRLKIPVFSFCFIRQWVTQRTNQSWSLYRFYAPFRKYALTCSPNRDVTL